MISDAGLRLDGLLARFDVLFFLAFFCVLRVVADGFPPVALRVRELASLLDRTLLPVLALRLAGGLINPASAKWVVMLLTTVCIRLLSVCTT